MVDATVSMKVEEMVAWRASLSDEKMVSWLDERMAAVSALMTVVISVEN